MQMSRFPTTMPPSVATFLCFCCFSVSCLGQVFDQQYKYGEARPAKNRQNNEDSSYAPRHETFDPPHQHSLKDINPVRHTPSSNANRPVTNTEAHKLHQNTNGDYLVNQEWSRWIMPSSASDDASKGSVDKRFLDPIASHILKRDSGSPGSYYFVTNDGSNFQNIGLTEKIFVPKATRALPDILLTSPAVNYYDSDYETDLEDYNEGQTYDNIYYKDKYATNSNSAHWPQEGSHNIETQPRGPSTKSKFNDSFHKHLATSKTSGIQKRFLDSIAGEIIKKDHESKTGTVFSKQNNERKYFDNAGTSVRHKHLHVEGVSHVSEDGNFPLVHTEGMQGSESNVAQGAGSTGYIQRPGSSIWVQANRGDSSDRGYQTGLYLQENVGEVKGQSSSEVELEDEIKGQSSSEVELEEDLDHVSREYVHKLESGQKVESSTGEQKRYLDGIASSLIKKDDGEKRYLDGIASSLIKKNDGEKRYLDGIASSLIKKNDGEKRYLDGIASSLIKKNDGEKRYLDGIASSLIKKRSSVDDHLESLKTVAGSTPELDQADIAGHTGTRKRAFEVTDDVMDGTRKAKRAATAPAGTKELTVATTFGNFHSLKGSNSRGRRATRVLILPEERSSLLSARHRHKRFIDGIASNILYKRFEFNPRSLKFKSRQLPTSAETWNSQGTLQRSSQEAEPGRRLAHQPQSWKESVRDVEFQRQSKVKGERLLEGGQGNNIYNSDLDILFRKPPSRRERNLYSHGDFFDEIAGDLLT